MSDSPTAPPDADREFDALLDFLKRNRGIDLSGYKRTGLMRRFRKRMQRVEFEDFAGYLDHLEVHPAEFAHLFDTLLINVTGFFRDPEAWQALAEEAIPRLLAARPGQEPIRVWCAGCSTGEEAYTLVMALAEAMGVEAFRARAKVYATDIDEQALTRARLASYTAREVEDVPAELRERYFEQVNGRYVFRNDLRRYVIFGRNDLSEDAPISHLDLLSCRNTLMYFNAEAQSRILSRFHFALEDHGLLFLGRAEMLLTRSHIFRPLDMKSRIFTKVPRPGLQERLLVLAQGGSREALDVVASPDPEIREVALDAAPVAQLVVDADGDLALVNEQARSLFRLAPQDVGRALKDLEVSYRPLELRSRIEQAYEERRPVYVSGVRHPLRGGAAAVLDVQVVPLLMDGRVPLGVSIHFIDVTPYRRIQTELQHANEQLETAYEELQATNEELETTNEELQSTVEELETTNEELQSTNEELETMNEELHSTNEELETINDELRRRTDELNRVSGYMEAILSSLRMGVAVLDDDLRVHIWNAEAEDLWGAREDEVEGEAFPGLDIGLPVGDLEGMLRKALDGQSREAVVDATNRRGRPLRCRVVASPLQNAGGERWGAILLMEEWEDGSGDPDRTPTTG